jgi:hypothetical protein
MAHPKLQLSRLLDWLKLRIECEDTSPTDEQIAAFLGLDSERTAMSMLADLADRGDITIRGSGAARHIALGRQHRAIETPRPVPSIAKPKRAPISEEECTARIQAIMSLGKTKQPDSPTAALIPSAAGEGGAAGAPAVLPSDGALCQSAAPPTFDPKQPDSPAAELEAPASGEGERLEVSDLRAPAPSVPIAAPPYSDLPAEVLEQLSQQGQEAVAKGERLAIKRLPTAPRKAIPKPRPVEYQINIKVSAAIYDELRRRADGRHAGPLAKRIFEAAMSGEPPAASAPTPLFRIPAEVTRAAIRDGIPVLDLAATLMMRGLGSFEQDAARERAA